MEANSSHAKRVEFGQTHCEAKKHRRRDGIEASMAVHGVQDTGGVCPLSKKQARRREGPHPDFVYKSKGESVLEDFGWDGSAFKNG